MEASVLGWCFGSPLSGGGFELNGALTPFVWLVPLSVMFDREIARPLFGSLGTLQSCPLLVVVDSYLGPLCLNLCVNEIKVVVSLPFSKIFKLFC